MAHRARCRQTTALVAHRDRSPLFDVVFDILTADTFVAGIATKILDGESIPHNERVIVVRSPLVVNNSWLYEGRPFDLSVHPTILAVARAVENTRALCCRIIDAR